MTTIRSKTNEVMPYYTLLEIAASYDRPLTTTHRHIKQLEKDKKFTKKSPGKHYNDEELKKLQELMGFQFRNNQD